MHCATPQASRKDDALFGSESQHLTIVSDFTILQLVSPAPDVYNSPDRTSSPYQRSENEIHHPPRRHGGALRERITRRTELQERKEQVLEEQEGQASSGSVSAEIRFRGYFGHLLIIYVGLARRSASMASMSLGTASELRMRDCCAGHGMQSARLGQTWECAGKKASDWASILRLA